MEKFVYDKKSLPRPIYDDRFLAVYDTAWQMAFNNIDYVEKAGWKPILTCMPGSGKIWQWDSCFLTLFTNYSNGTLNAFDNLDNLYRVRRESDGYISMAYKIEDDSPAYGERINPPLYAWVEWEHYLVSGDSSRFERVMPAIEGLYNFIENNRRRLLGLYYFEDTGSSGMDNSPRSGFCSKNLDGSDVCFVDLACQQSLSALCMSKMFEVMGNQEKAEFYKAENERINELINKYHYVPKTGFYHDFFARSAAYQRINHLGVKTAAVFWALLCGAATGDRLKRVVEHMMNPDEFYTHTPFASLAKDDINYDPTGGYWLGASWHPTTFVAVRGLFENGYKKEAREASLKFLDVIEKTGGIWECYSPEENQPATREEGITVRPNFVGWGGLFPITVLIEYIIGLRFNAPEKTVTFEINEDKRCGIENMLFCGKPLDIVYENGKVTVKCEMYFTLIVNGEKHDLTAGEHIINL